jgi:O-antigen polymerase
LFPYNQMGQIFFFTELFAVVSPLFIVYYFFELKQKIDLIQILILLFIIWIVIRGKEGGIWHDEKFFYFSGCFAFFFVVRKIIKNVLDKDTHFQTLYISILVVSITVIVGTEALIGLLQASNKFTIYNADYRVTGTFFNPAQFAGFLVVAAPWTLYLSVPSKKNIFFTIISWLGLLSITLVILVIPISYSRSGYLGLGTVLVIWLYHQYAMLNFFKKILNTRFKRIVSFGIITTIIIIAFIKLYNFKPESAFGRILIWKVALLAIKERPLDGYGFNAFQVVFAPFQAAYFSAEPRTNREQMVAGSVRWAFNEYLQTAIELGIIGCLLLIVIFAYALFCKAENSLSRQQFLFFTAARASVAGMAVFAFFSNPFHSLPIALLFFFSLSIVSCFLPTLKNKDLPASVNIVSLLLILFVSINFCKNQPEIKQGYREWNYALRLCRLGKDELAIENFEKAKLVLGNNGLLLQHYGSSLIFQNKYQEALTILCEAKKYYYDYELCITLGDCQEKLDNNEEAIKNYQLAGSIIPHKFYPRYLLALLYKKIGEREKAFEIANELINKPVKIESEEISKIKTEMNEFIELYNNK